VPAGVDHRCGTPVTRAAGLVGDGVENPANARALLDAAAMFGVPCLFRDSRGLAGRWSVERGGQPLTTVDTHELRNRLTPLVAVENTPDAASVFTADLPPGRPAIVVGNERRGVRPDLLRVAATHVRIPMRGRGVNTLNVAAAAAVALYYLLNAAGRRGPRSTHPDTHRPAVLLLGPGDHVEAGSTLRSAAAFGWRAVGLDDRDKVWFGTPRAVRGEGRAAARSHRNPLRVLPARADPPVGFSRVIVAGTRVGGPPLHRTNLAGGPGTVLVIPDEGSLDPPEDWRRLGRKVEFTQVELPRTGTPYRYRLAASIVLAEVARQLGTRRADPPARSGRHPLTYDSALKLRAPTGVDLVMPHELDTY
jgi:tRNA G18 (ribose-2'-O)-methylase SpoU